MTVIEIPVASDYRIDPNHSTISFTTRHMFGLAPVRGTFALREGNIRVADPVGSSTARATIAADSVDTANSRRDASVRSAQYLDVENHPDITFVSTGLSGGAEGGWTLHGSLTVRGSTQPIDIRVEAAEVDNDARLRLRANCQVDRYEFGITAMKGMAGRRLTLRLDIVADRG